MKLGDFKDDRAIDVIAALLPHVRGILSNKEVMASIKKSGTMMDVAHEMFKGSREDTVAILAILNEEDPADYHFDATTLYSKTLEMISDPDLLVLFGLQRQTSASSGSASENTGAQKG